MERSGAPGFARRQAVAFLRSKDIVHKLFDEIGPRFAQRPGGYARIVRIGPRLGRPEIAGFALALKRRRMREYAVAAVKRFQVKAWNVAQSIRSLSGGNQQKVAIAQALHRRPRLLLLEEPTRGVDIRSKREIYRLLHDYVADGNAVIMFCTEVLEVYEAADRAFVVAEGSLSNEIRVRDYDHVERLATDITRLERHHRGEA